MRIFVLDAGNTAIKLGCYTNGGWEDTRRFASNDLETLLSVIQDEKPDELVISSVISDSFTTQLLKQHSGTIVSPESNLPILSTYETPKTLGMDRLCNAVAVHKTMSTKYGVAIDMGTCIKFDLVGKDEGYMGGSISPGVDLRYRSLNDHTEKLPLLSNKSTTPLVGKDTNTSIWSGVINGMNAEIEGLISQYESRFEHLTFFMTGGDAAYFDIHAKNDIFAIENLTLMGLLEIYKHNA